jgi:hypothetical protein
LLLKLKPRHRRLRINIVQPDLLINDELVVLYARRKLRRAGPIVGDERISAARNESATIVECEDGEDV